MQDLSRHLKEAIAINLNRMPLYGKLSDGATIAFSKKLIRYEKIALLGAWILDRKGDQLQRKDIPYIKAEFVDMALIPIFSETYPQGIDFKEPLRKIEIQAYVNTIKKALSKSDYFEIIKASQCFLDDLSDQIHVYCLLRHLIESLARIAYLIPLHQARCSENKIKDPTAYSRLLLKVHCRFIKAALEFDEAIGYIQNKGIPFIYQDLPSIEIKASYP